MDFWRLHRRLMAWFALFCLLAPQLVQAASLGIGSVRTSPEHWQVHSASTLPPDVQAMESATLNRLFDRDTRTEYTAFADQSLDVTLPDQRQVTAIRVFGAAPYKLTVQQAMNSGWRDVQGLKNLDLTQLPETWNSFSTNNPVRTGKLRLVLEQATSASAGLKELEIWSNGEHVPVETGSQLLSRLEQKAMDDQGLLAAATPSEGVIGSISPENPDDPTDNTFSLDLDVPPSQIKYAYLVYETFGLAHWMNAARVINDQPAMGGVIIEGNDAWTQQIERVSPVWLREGKNRVRFTKPSDKELLYRVRNVRVVAELDNGANFVSYIGASQTEANDTIDALYDGSTDTGMVIYSGTAVGTSAEDSDSDVQLPPGLIDNPGQGLHLGWVKGNAPWKQGLSTESTVSDGERTVEIGFDRGVELEAVGFYLRGKLSGKIDVELYHDGDWQPSGMPAVSANSLKSGWVEIPVADGNKVRGARLVFTGGDGSSGEIRELTVRGSGIGGAWLPPEIVVNYPDAGQYYGRQAYVRGFLQGTANDSGEAQLFIGGQPLNQVNGEFQTLIAKGDVGLEDQADDDAWAVQVEAVYPDGERSTTFVPFFVNKGSLEDGLEADVPPVDYIPITPEQGANGSFEGAGIVADPGAVDEELEVSMMPLSDMDLAALDTWMTNVTGPHAGYRFLPHGKHFNKKIEVRMKYQPSLLPPGFSEDDIRTFYFDEQAGKWKELETRKIDKSKKEVVAMTDHFTDMINAVIQVPDSPQNTQFNPTQIKDIKAADPGAKINLIEPPQANNMGDARLSYPIELPPGRRGLQPQLGLQYNSGGGHGWVGHGWDISMQSITIDTRWGVPRYDDAKETETYLLNGEQLTPLAHRGELRDREAEKEFHTRVEGQFRKIIRHGDSPDNYWWEVIDKSGTQYFYGGDDTSGGPVEDATLETASGNIGKWSLRLVRDSNGNEIHYDCVRIEDSGIGNGSGGVPGQQLYLDKIYYTGYQGQKGAYAIDFIRDREESGFDPATDRRPDVKIDARLGLKQVTADLLKRIDIDYNGQRVRSYSFAYEEGAYAKTLLDKVTQLDSEGQVFNDHEFSYYDEIRNEQGTYAGYQARQWSTPDDGLEGNLYAGKGEISVLGGSESSGRGKHIYAGVGPGLTLTKSQTVGYKVGSNKSQSEGVSALVDINGDGLPDKVFRKGGLFYRPNLSGPGGDALFGPAIPIIGASSFSEEKTTMRSRGPEAYWGGAMVGRNKATTTSVSKTYFSDVNGDGLIDIVSNGSALFNHPQINAEREHTGQVTFSANSADTPNPVGSGGVDATQLFEDFEQEYQEAIDNAPLHDSIRRWVAPYDGTVRVSGDVELKEYTTEERERYQTADGVRVAIQLNDSELWSTTIEAKDHGPKTPVNVEEIAVEKGDKFYFRVQSREDGAFDGVSWTPVIEYLGEPEPEPEEDQAEGEESETEDAESAPELVAIEKTGATGRNLYRYAADEDFVTTGSIHARTVVPEDGRIAISGDFVKHQETTDDIDIRVLRNSQVLFDETVEWNDLSTLALDLEADVSRDDRIRFDLSSDSPVDLNKIEWSPRITYLSLPAVENGTDENGNPISIGDVEDENGDALSITELTDPEGNPLFIINAVYDADIYSRFEHSAPIEPWMTEDEGELTVIPHVTLPDETIGEDKLFLTVKSEGELIAKTDIQIELQEDPETGEDEYVQIPNEFSFDVEFSGDNEERQYHFEYSTRDTALADRLESLAVEVTYDGSEPEEGEEDNRNKIPVNVALYSQHQDLLFGRQYRNWSYLAYNGNRERADQPIDESLLVLPDVDPDDIREPEGPEDAESPVDVTNLTAIPFYPDPSKDRWTGLDDQSWIAAEDLRSSRLGEDHIEVPRPGSFAGRRAVQRLSVTKNDGVSAGYLAAGSSKSDAEVRSLVDFLDVNGDRYPDVLGDGRVQFTALDGGLETNNRSVVVGDVRGSAAESFGLGLNGNFGTVVGSALGKDSVVTQQLAPLGFGGNVTEGETEPEFDLRDLNGDGLPDRVYNGGGVSLNLGYAFAAREPWPAYNLGESRSDGKSLSLSYNVDAYSFAGGVSVTESESTSNKGLIDINGDGLPDRVRVQANTPSGNGRTLFVGFNTGNGFLPHVEWGSVTQISRNLTVTQGAGAYFTVPVPILPPPFPTAFTVITNPGANWDKGVSSTEVAFNDINGDGYPDFLESDRDGRLNVKVNRNGRTNLLKSVERPLGASFELEYEREGNTYAMPQSKWVLSKVTVDDGFEGDGVDTQVTSFAYENGYQDRRERDFLGFETVVITEHDTREEDLPAYRSTTQTWLNGSVYERGLMARSLMTDRHGNPYTETVKRYRFVDIDDQQEISQSALPSQVSKTIFPQLAEEIARFYEGEQQPGKQTRKEYLAYDEVGNVTRLVDYADTGAADDVEADIDYFYDEAAWIMGAAESIKVYGNGELMRHRESTIEPGTGNVKDIRQFYEDGVARYDFQYDDYGNLETVTGPVNHKGERYALTYSYDNQVNTHVARIEDSFGYISTARHNYKWGQAKQSTDINNQTIRYTFDEVGRVKTITGPYEQASGQATITFAYHPRVKDSDPLNWALTQHYDPEHPSDRIETALFTDGLKRVLQTKKDGTVGDGEGEPRDVMIASGRVIFDHVGRTVDQYYPVTEPLGSAGTFNPAFDPIPPTHTEYDVLDRPLEVTIPDGTSTTFDYGFGTDRDGRQQFRTTVTDANGVEKDSFRDVRQLITAVKEYNKGGSEIIWTSYQYDPLKQITDVLDDQQNLTRADYDRLGRRTVLDNPDTGKVEMKYDPAGNLVTKITPNLREQGEAIDYQYDYNRLQAITYPEFAENNVTYEYGAPGNPHNGANRIIKVTDQAGWESRRYGPLGELTQSTRYVEWSAGPGERYTTQYEYDTWNRLQRLVYPDSEVLTLNYNHGGQVQAIHGRKGKYDYQYVQRLDYDKFEQRTYLRYGNNTENRYAYDPYDRRLAHLAAGKGDGNLFMDLEYGYDDVGNITELTNAAPVKSPNQMGGATHYSYEYDDLYRLTGSTGTFDTKPDKQHAYTLSMDYSTIHNIESKTQKHTLRQPSGKKITQKKTTYDWTYRYDGPQPHAPTHLGERTFSYDANGNQLGWTHDKNGTRRSITWDEENRIQAIADNGHTMTYTYDASGQRITKRGPQGETAYINQWFTLRNGEVGTKHVFAGTSRVVSKLVKQDKPNSERKGKIVYEKDQYYYHPDHLGTTAYITHTNGQVYQHLEYFPFGETWVEEHSNKQRTPYLFTAKELDEETGLYYFGARYYDPRTSVWQSPDPILAKYLPKGKGEGPSDLASQGGVYSSVNLDLYSYAGHNPIRAVDPNGKELVVKGGKAFVAAATADLQKIASEASVNAKTGQVSVGTWATVKAYLTGDTGTKLVASLANSENTITVNKGVPGSGNSAAPSSWAGAINGSGTDVDINYDLSSNPSIPTIQPDGKVKGQKGRPNFIGLGHELIHAKHMAEGDVEGTISSSGIISLDQASHTYIDASGKPKVQNYYQEELRTSGVGGHGDWFGPSENDIRKQHNLPERGAY